MSGYDGEIRIKTSLELKQLQQDIKEAEKTLKEYKKEDERLEKESNDIIEKYYRERYQEIAKLQREADATRKKITQREQGDDRDFKYIEELKGYLAKAQSEPNADQSYIESLQKNIELRTAQYNEGTQQLIATAEQYEEQIKAINSAYEQELAKSDEAWTQNLHSITQTEIQIEELNEQYQNAQQEIIKYNEQLKQQKQHEKELRETKKSIEGIGKTIKGATNSIIRWGLSLIGISSIFSLISKAMDKIRKNNAQLNANLSYIGFVASKIFDNLLFGVDKMKNGVNGLVGLLYKAVVYIGYILSKWFNTDLFKGTSVSDYAKSMESANKSAKSTAKSTKEIKKDLMGFDEVNKLSENTSSGGSGSGDKITLPTLPNIKDIPIPGWVDWIARNKDIILKVVGAIMGLLTFNKIVSWLKPLGDFFGLFGGGKLATSMGGILGMLGEMALIIGSIALISYSIGEYAEQRTGLQRDLNRLYDNGLKYAKQDAKTVTNIKDTQEVLNYKTKKGLDLLWDRYSLENKIFGTTKQAVKQAEGVALQGAEYLRTQFQLYKQGKLNNEDQKKLVELIKSQKDYAYTVYDALEKEGMSTENLSILTDEYNDMLEEMGVHVLRGDELLKSMGIDVDKLKEKTGFWKTQAKAVEGAVGGAVEGLGTFNKTKINDKTAKINLDADTTKANKSLGDWVKSLGSKLSNLFGKLDLSGLGKNLADAFKKAFPNVVKAGSEMYNKIKNAFKTTKAREGGIINVPGRGVPIGTNIIGGEAGPEAILPLNDKTLDRLGSSIARHMNVNLTNVTQMNGRTISRELKQIMNESEFTYNG